MGVNRCWCRFSLLDAQGSVVAGGELAGPILPDIGAVNVIARLALIAKQTGTTFHLADACPELLELIELAGLPVQVER